MKTIVLGTSSSDANYNADCDFAFVKVNKEYAKALMRLRATLLEVKRNQGPHGIESDLHQMEYFDNNIRMFNVAGWEPAEDVKMPEDSSQYSIVDREWEPADDSEQRTICRTLHVLSDGFYWEASPKHTSIWIETAMVSIEDIRKIAEEPCTTP